MKSTLYVVLFLLSYLFSSAQSVTGQEIRFLPHWLIQVQGGAGYTLGEIKMHKLISPSVGLYGGYQITPVWGLRVGLSGWQSKGGWAVTKQPYTYKYVQLNADALLNLSNWLAVIVTTVFSALMFSEGVLTTIVLTTTKPSPSTMQAMLFVTFGGIAVLSLPAAWGWASICAFVNGLPSIWRVMRMYFRTITTPKRQTMPIVNST